MSKIENARLANSNPIGYGKPPASSRFQPGKSGNPKGRPKGSLNFAAIVLATAREVVVINENGKRKQITKLQAAVKQLVNKAASGDLRACNQLMDLTLVAEQRAAEEHSPSADLADLDLKVALNILKRIEQGAREDDRE